MCCFMCMFLFISCLHVDRATGAVASGCLSTGRRLWAFEGVSAIFEQGHSWEMLVPVLLIKKRRTWTWSDEQNPKKKTDFLSIPIRWKCLHLNRWHKQNGVSEKCMAAMTAIYCVQVDEHCWFKGVLERSDRLLSVRIMSSIASKTSKHQAKKSISGNTVRACMHRTRLAGLVCVSMTDTQSSPNRKKKH